MNTPYQWTKQVASHWGGTRNGTIVHWPNGIEEKGGLRSQFSHVIDVAPTILEAAGLPEPAMVNGVMQSPMEGTSMLYSFNDGGASERHELQYFEMFGNRGIYHKGWSAVTKHKTPWIMVGGQLPAFDDDVWELYDGNEDYSQARNLASEQPDRLAALQRLWLIEAVKYNVLPLDDRSAERLEPSSAGRPTLVRGNSQQFFAGMGRLSENSVVSIKNKSFSGHGRGRRPRRRRGRRDHRAGRPLRRLDGLLQGRQGEVRLQHARHPRVLDGRRHRDPRRHPPGANGVRLRRRWARQGWRRHSLRRRERGRHWSGGEHPPDDLLRRRDDRHRSETGTTVTPDYTAKDSRFTGKINWVQLDVGTDDHDHLIDPDERVRIAMARQ